MPQTVTFLTVEDYEALDRRIRALESPAADPPPELEPVESASPVVTGLVATNPASGKIVLDWDALPGFDAARGDLYRVYGREGGLLWSGTTPSHTRTVGDPTGSFTYSVGAFVNGVESLVADRPSVSLLNATGPVIETTPDTPPPPATTTPRGLLRTAPPVLAADYGTVTIPAGHTGPIRLAETTRDYRIILPSTPLRGRHDLIGGRNRVLIGGSISSGTVDKPVMSIHGGYGSVHVEGVEFGRADETVDQDFIVVDERVMVPGSQISLVNIKGHTVSGSYEANHADILQVYGMSAGTRLVVEKLDATSGYQGLMWQPKQFGVNPDSLEMIDVVLRHTADATGYLIYYGGSTVPFKATNVKLVNGAMYSTGIPVPAGISRVTSAVSPLVGTPGVNYVSPGYATS